MSAPRTHGDADQPAHPPARPVWVRVAFLVAGAVALLLLVAALAGEHGPWRHLGAAPDRTSPTVHVSAGTTA